MRHALATHQLSNIIGYAYQMGVTFKPSKKSPGFMELKSWPKGKTAQEIKDYFKDANAAIQSAAAEHPYLSEE